ncbi:putative lipase [Gordonia araii NBRC 100433]|uniref:Putative lipase n=1 Tax=Gordonia araii NBRC 100433 TaxID=1073574 RepID=G7H5W3_9ACTN|nr:lipase family protein [Gordonia araii]NNG95686.1 lipase [Gordonia araii NBRC 100433]GAB11238.1 putative lipase [Gordonia araii NBRC 100433]
MPAELFRSEDDPFYSAPPALASMSPGRVIRSRRVALAAFGKIPVGMRAWQLAYRTIDVHGAPDLAVTTILVPRGGGQGLLSFQCAIDGVSTRCLPSYALRRHSRAAGALSQVELPLILAALARGWAVSVPDHGGLRGHFGAAREPGYRALDAVRAALAFDRFGLAPDTPVGLWGYSGGGLATVWAAEVAGDYAPELNLVGAAAGSPVGDPRATFLRLNGGWFSGFPTVFIAGLRRAYPQLIPVFDRHLDRRFGEWLDDAANRTTLVALARLTRRDIRRHLRHGLDDLLAEPALASVLEQVRPGHTAPEMPLLIVQGLRDEVINAADVSALVGRYRAAGARLTYRLVPFGWHLPLEFATAPGALRWLGERRASATTDREPLAEMGEK